MSCGMRFCMRVYTYVRPTCTLARRSSSTLAPLAQCRSSAVLATQHPCDRGHHKRRVLRLLHASLGEPFNVQLVAAGQFDFLPIWICAYAHVGVQFREDEGTKLKSGTLTLPMPTVCFVLFAGLSRAVDSLLVAALTSAPAGVGNKCVHRPFAARARNGCVRKSSARARIGV